MRRAQTRKRGRETERGKKVSNDGIERGTRNETGGQGGKEGKGQIKVAASFNQIIL